MTKTKIVPLAVIWLIVTLAGLSQAGTITVGPGAGYDFSTIQAAIDAAVDSDVVIVAPGTYTGGGNRNLDFGGKAVTVVSQSGPSATIIDGNDSSVVVFDDDEGQDAVLQGFTIRGGGPTVVIANASPTILENVITGYVVTGSGSMDRVAGIDVFGSSSPTISGNIITGNVAAVGGGSTAVGAIKISGSSSPVIRNNIIAKNGATGAGSCTIVGGIWVCAPASPVIINNTIANNCSSGSGGCILVGGVASLKPCPTCGGAWRQCPECRGLGWVLQSDAGPLLANNIVWGNSVLYHEEDCTIADDFYAKGAYSLIGSGITDGVGNITGNPMLSRSLPVDKVRSTCPFPFLFMAPDQLVLCPPWRQGLSFAVGDTLELNFDGVPRTVLEVREHEPHWDSMTVVFSPDRTKHQEWYGQEYVVNWGSETDLSLDYHLLADSPCINAGDPAGDYSGQSDIDGEPRVIGGHVDMGADESPYEPPTLVRLVIVGPNEVVEESSAQYRAIAYYDNDSTKDVTASTIWLVEPGTYASIDENGLLTIERIDTRQDITIYAEYTEGEATLNAQKSVSCIPYIAPGRTYHIDGINGDDDNDGLTLHTAFATIQKGIDSAEDGDTVLVWPGLYQENIILLDTDITVQSADHAAVIDGDGGVGVAFCTGGGLDSTLKNFVIKNCYLGVYCLGGSPTINNVTIVDNDFGVGVYAGAQPNISNCILWDNTDGDLEGEGWQVNYSYIQGEIESNLVSHWKFDEGNGTTAYDWFGLNDGTIHGAEWTTGPVNGALSFDRNNMTYVSVPDDASLNITGDITISAWVYFTQGGSCQAIVTKCVGNGPRNNPFDFRTTWHAEPSLALVRADASAHERVYSTVDIPLREWHHVLVRVENKVPDFYVDGVVTRKYADTTFTRTPTGNATPLLIGARDDGLYFNGIIDEVAIYNRALSAEEIQSIYQAGLAGHEYGSLFADANGGDYHLLSERGRYWPAHDVWVLDKVTSPCVDGGDPTVDPAGEPMPNGGRINMGAYGGTPYASMSQWWPPGDINHDGVVNMIDLAIIAENWLECEEAPSNRHKESEQTRSI